MKIIVNIMKSGTSSVFRKEVKAAKRTFFEIEAVFPPPFSVFENGGGREGAAFNPVSQAK